ncbi:MULTISPECIES: hypothetical protein [Acinetobacter]|uniref:hypothetical protein n=1 Tax=Acinetobacter TaxID=469 RepID=UPI000E5BEB99|nr:MULTISPECIES: hypothetical protein [Acinetobacter]MDA3493549.1 hypothetical protein [Acinetobacter sp. AOR33_HL]MDH0180160.1 hypothetical protein [Acinetobacter pittii]RTA16840.1 hypothetical protein EJ483_10745 [Acinetobacter pittii]RZH14860.1 hypothetical protein EXD95_18745 [Acinetobacter pittii]
MPLFDLTQAIGVGFLIIPFIFISIVFVKKAKKLARNEGISWAIFFSLMNIAFISAPLLILLGAYSKSALFFFTSISSTFLAISTFFIYEKYMKRTFILRVDKTLYDKLYHQAKDQKTNIKSIIYDKIR